jgi:hypothetical protein
MRTDIEEKVLEKLATGDKATIVVERQSDGKMRVTSGSWVREKVILRDQVLEVHNVEGGCTSPANRASTTSGTRMSRPTIRMAQGVRMSSPMTEATRHAESENDLAIAETRHARKRQQSAARNQRMRARRRLGLVMRTLPLQREWLDALETRGYLDPFDRTIAKAEVEAVRKFLGGVLHPASASRFHQSADADPVSVDASVAYATSGCTSRASLTRGAADRAYDPYGPAPGVSAYAGDDAIDDCYRKR